MKLGQHIGRNGFKTGLEGYYRMKDNGIYFQLTRLVCEDIRELLFKSWNKTNHNRNFNYL